MVPDPEKGSQRPGRGPRPRMSRDSPSALGGFTSTPRAGALSPVWGLPGNPGLRTPPGSKKPKFPDFGEKGEKGPKKGLPGVPRQKAPKRGYRAPPRGVDVKDPSKAGPDPSRKGQKGPKARKRPKKAIFRDFGHFSPKRGVLALRGPSGPSRGGCFYINPSRRGPVAPPGGSGVPAPWRGGTPERGQGVSPWGVAVEGCAARRRPALRPRSCKGKFSLSYRRHHQIHE